MNLKTETNYIHSFTNYFFEKALYAIPFYKSFKSF